MLHDILSLVLSKIFTLKKYERITLIPTTLPLATSKYPMTIFSIGNEITKQVGHSPVPLSSNKRGKSEEKTDVTDNVTDNVTNNVTDKNEGSQKRWSEK